MYQRTELGFGHAGGAAVLTLDRALSSFPVRADPLREAVRTARAWAEDTDFVVDLGARIGSREWWRGALTCAALCATAWSMGPTLGPIAGAASPALPDAQWQEARAIGFSPLAYGADTGRRMGATQAVEILAETPDRPRIELTATLGRGDGFVRALQRAGIGDSEARQIGDIVAQAAPLGSIEAGTRMDIVLGRRASKHDARPLDSLHFRAKLDLALTVARADAGAPLQLKRIPIAVDDTPLRIEGRVGNSLYITARAAGVPAKAVQAYLRALGTGVSARADDRFDMVIAQRRAETGEVEIGELLYAGLDQGRRKLRMVKWTNAGRTQWFEASGVGERKGSFQRPVVGHLTSSFGMRFHPLLGYSRLHKGVDYGAASGSPIVAVTDGVVAFAGWHGGHGNFVKLNHAGGLGSGYGHMSRIAVRPGQHVSQGQIIGYVGSTGLSTGPHLHFEVYRGGAAVNPASVSFTSQAQLAGAELRKFKSTLASYLAVRPGAAAAFARKRNDSDEKVAESADRKLSHPHRG